MRTILYDALALRGRPALGFGLGATPSLPTLPTTLPTLPTSTAAAGACAPYASDSQFQSAFGPIANQIAAEGGADPSGNVIFAQQAFCNSLQGLSSQFGMQYSDALAAASNFVAIAHTAQGAIQHVAGLMQAVQSGAPAPVVVSQMAGLVVGVGIATGIVTAGIGAAVMAGISLVGGLLGGLFQAAPGVTVCSGVTCNPPPTFVVNCVCFWDAIVQSPGSQTSPNPLWRHFPQVGDTGPLGASWYSPNANGGRLIDTVFPSYRQLECERAAGWAVQGTSGASVSAEQSTAIAGFMTAFLGAWMSNAEYTVNGLTAAADWQVLVNTARMWNAAHAPGQGFTFNPVPKSNLCTVGAVAPYGGTSPQCLQLVGGSSSTIACPSSSNPTATCPAPSAMSPYASMLITDALQQSTQPGTDVPNGVLSINTGPQLSVPQTLLITSGGAISSSASSSSSSSAPPATAGASSPSSSASSSSSAPSTATSPAAALAVGAIGGSLVAGGAVAVYAAHHGITVGEALRRLFR